CQHPSVVRVDEAGETHALVRHYPGGFPLLVDIVERDLRVISLPLIGLGIEPVPTCQGTAVGLESQLLRTIAVSILLMPSEAGGFAAGAGLPKPEIAVCGSSDQVASVRGESQADDPVLFSDPTARSPDRHAFLAGFRVPDPNHPILARRRRRSPVGRDCP